MKIQHLAVVPALCATVSWPAAAEVPLSECGAAVGTFLTRNSLPDGDSGTLQTRSLITFSAEGLATRNDSDQDGGVVGTPFGEGRGAWRCDAVEGNTTTLTAVILNFGYSPEGETPTLARMDYRGSYDSGSNVLRLDATLIFLPLDSDPFAGTTTAETVPVAIDGMKVSVP
jgi:hypothetical protein